MNDWRNTIRRTSFAWGAFLYFLAIALTRESPYWPHGMALPWPVGLILALLPLLPGLVARKPSWLIRGMIIATLTPFQSGVLFALVAGGAVLAVRMVRDIRNRIVPNPLRRDVLLAVAAYCIFVVIRVVWEWGAVHTWISIGFSVSVQYLPVCAALVTAYVARTRSRETLDDMLSIFLAHGVVLIVYPLIVGHPQLLLSVVNGVLKPVYSVLGYAWTYPWYDPDWNPGSVSIVNYSGVIMTIAVVLTFARVLRSRRIADIALLVFFTLAAFMAENAMAVAAAAGALAATLFAVAVYRRLGRHTPFRGWAAASTCAAAALLLFLFATYLPGGRYETTHKGHYFTTQVANISERPMRFVTGYGPGAYGSRIAYLRIPADPYSTASILHGTYGGVFASASLPANEFTTDFQRISQSPADWVSESQGLIVSGLVAFVAENGLLGIVLLLGITLLLLRSSGGAVEYPAVIQSGTWPDTVQRAFPPVFLVFLSVFYNYTEIPCLMFLAVLLASLPGSGRGRE